MYEENIQGMIGIVCSWKKEGEEWKGKNQP
jgi:hypothetical protein